MKLQIKLNNERARLHVAPSSKHTRRFLVYYDGTYSSLAALKAALNAADVDTEITAVAFIPVPATQPYGLPPANLLSDARVALASAITNAAMRGVKITTEIIQGYDRTLALAGLAAEYEAERIFMGGEGFDDKQLLDPLPRDLQQAVPSQITYVGQQRTLS